MGILITLFISARPSFQ